MWCNFDHVLPEIVWGRDLRGPPSGSSLSHTHTHTHSLNLSLSLPLSPSLSPARSGSGPDVGQTATKWLPKWLGCELRLKVVSLDSSRLTTVIRRGLQM